MKKESNEDKNFKVSSCFVPCFTTKKNDDLAANNGVMEAHNWAVEANNGVLEAHSEAEETVADSRQPLTIIRIRIKKTGPNPR